MGWMDHLAPYLGRYVNERLPTEMTRTHGLATKDEIEKTNEESDDKKEDTMEGSFSNEENNGEENNDEENNGEANNTEENRIGKKTT